MQYAFVTMHLICFKPFVVRDVGDISHVAVFYLAPCLSILLIQILKTRIIFFFVEAWVLDSATESFPSQSQGPEDGLALEVVEVVQNEKY